MIKFAVMTESDIFGQEQKKKKKKNYSGSRIQDFAELSIGDFVVHEKHGLGIYRGIEKVEVDRIVKIILKLNTEAEAISIFLLLSLTVCRNIQGQMLQRLRS